MASRTITIRAKPAAIDIDTAKTAVMVVDMQNDFASKGGLFDHAGIEIAAAKGAIPHIQSTLATARGVGIPVIYLKMGFQPDLSDLGDSGSPTRERHLRLGVGQPCNACDGRQGRFLIRDTWNTEIIDELRPEPEDIVLYKHRFSGFYQTDLDNILRRLGIKYLIFIGCTTSVCVESTIRDAMFRDYRCLLLSDCIGEPIGNEFPRSNHEASILTIQTVLGWVSDSVRFESALRNRTVASASA